uniref:S8 family serine peptidase n=1 Tax=Winogradskyella sp. TaxID=1883156 RepID=UPI0025E890B9
ILCFAIMGFLSYSCFAQQEMSKEQFQNLDKTQQELYLSVKKADALKTVRINEYLSINREQKRVVKENGKVFVLTDVIDGKPMYMTTDNEDAALATGTNHLQVGGSLGLDLDGSGITVRVWDGGPVQNTHVEFQNADNTASRITNVESINTDGTGDQDFHGTHVTGTISAKGVDPSAKGMASAITVRTYNFLNDSPEMLVAVNEPVPMILSNHSYGLPINQAGGSQLDPWQMGAYSSGARTVDGIARANPKYLIVMSAGNGGTDSYPGGLAPGFDKLTGDKNAKNNLVVANASPTLNINPFTGEVNMTFVVNTSSSQGPTDDLRIKPDIAGDGTGLTSPVPGDTYGTISGTSMASPNVTGSLALLQQYYNQLNGEYMNASTLKALVCHTALDDTNTAGPDPNFGWGLLDAKRSAEVLTEANNSMSIVDELKIDDGDTYVLNFGAQAGEKLSATICWTDVQGVAASGSGDLNNQTPRLINDLDLRITKDGGATYLPWKLDYSGSGFSNSKADNVVDNVERIDIDVPESGNYSLVVSHKGTLATAVPLAPKVQNFSLIVTGNTLTLGVDDNNILDDFVVFPNPSKGEFTISFDSSSNNDDEVKISVFDVSGRQVYNNIFINGAQKFNETINLEGIQAGVYIANISQGNSSISHKLVIE